MELEENVKRRRTLVLAYVVHGEYRTVVNPGQPVSRALEDALRGITGIRNVDPRTVRFRIED